MKRERLDERSSLDDLPELDVLVLAEIESLSRAERPRARRPAAGADARGKARPALSPRPAAEGGVVRIRGAEPGGEGLSGEESEGLFDEALIDGGVGPDPDDEVPLGGLLSVEEEAFITRAVGFLSQREHADMILGRVWEQLTELDPEAFYQAPVAAEPGQPAVPTAGASEPVSARADPPAGAAP
jgi:hypothetical protein